MLGKVVTPIRESRICRKEKEDSSIGPPFQKGKNTTSSLFTSQPKSQETQTSPLKTATGSKLKLKEKP